MDSRQNIFVLALLASALINPVNVLCVVIQVKILGGECLGSKREIADLRDRLEREENLQQEVRNESYCLRQTLLQIEAEREAVKQSASKNQRR